MESRRHNRGTDSVGRFDGRNKVPSVHLRCLSRIVVMTSVAVPGKESGVKTILVHFSRGRPLADRSFTPSSPPIRLTQRHAKYQENFHLQNSHHRLSVNFAAYRDFAAERVPTFSYLSKFLPGHRAPPRSQSSLCAPRTAVVLHECRLLWHDPTMISASLLKLDPSDIRFPECTESR